MREMIHSQNKTSAFLEFEQKIRLKSEDIEQWFQSAWKITPPPVYGSMDLRHSGFKIAPVDMNLFPAGFNNLNAESQKICIDAARRSIRTWTPDAKHVLLIPEHHTRNRAYWQNIAALTTILENAGFIVHLGVFEMSGLTVSYSENETVTITPIQREQNQLRIEGIVPDLILLNNDLSEEIPLILQNVDQPILPPVQLGWHQRLKSNHFRHYQAVSQAFSSFLDMDPWLISPLYRVCENIDFKTRSGETCLRQEIGDLFEAIREKYVLYGIQQAPFVIVKADRGTYGMAVMTIRHPDEIDQLNRKQRTHMAVSKGKQPVHRVIIQEGVYSFETAGPMQSVAEPVVYLWGERVVGGFYRVHQHRGPDENLNSPGMHFEPLPFCLDNVSSETASKSFYLYSVIARLSMLAAAHEIQGEKP